MMRRYVLLGAMCASLMLGLAAKAAVLHPLWRLSFVPESAARQDPSPTRVLTSRPALVPAAPGRQGASIPGKGDTAH